MVCTYLNVTKVWSVYCSDVKFQLNIEDGAFWKHSEIQNFELLDWVNMGLIMREYQTSKIQHTSENHDICSKCISQAV